MPSIAGKYVHYKNEDLDNYFEACGLPYMVRKMISIITPVMEFTVDGEIMTLKVTSMILTTENTFKLGEEYEEKMPREVLKSVTRIVGDSEVVTDSVFQSNGHKTQRHYLFTDEEVIETLSHEKAKGVTKRYYRRETS